MTTTQDLVNQVAELASAELNTDRNSRRRVRAAISRALGTTDWDMDEVYYLLGTLTTEQLQAAAARA